MHTSACKLLSHRKRGLDGCFGIVQLCSPIPVVTCSASLGCDQDQKQKGSQLTVLAWFPLEAPKEEVRDVS